MRAVVNRHDLHDAAVLVARAATVRSSISVLACIELDMREESRDVVATATDLDMAIRMTVAADVIDGDGDGVGGKVLVNARMLVDILGACTDPTVTIESLPEAVLLSSGKASFKLQCINASEFPNLPFAAVEGSSVELLTDAVTQALRNSVKMASTDDARPILTGICIDPTDGVTRAVATDSYRLYVHDLATSVSTNTVLIPASVIGEVMKLINKTKASSITLAVGDRRAHFTIGRAMVWCNLIAGQYPPYQKLIPESTQFHLTCNAGALRSALKRAVLLARTGGPLVIDCTDTATLAGTVKLLVASADVADSVEDLDAETNYAARIAYNPVYLAAGVDAVAPNDDDVVTIAFNDTTKPGLVTSPSTPAARYVVMPVRGS